MKKKVIAVVLASAMAMTLAACGGSNTAPAAPAYSAPAASAPASDFAMLDDDDAQLPF